MFLILIYSKEKNEKHVLKIKDYFSYYIKMEVLIMTLKILFIIFFYKHLY